MDRPKQREMATAGETLAGRVAPGAVAEASQSSAVSVDSPKWFSELVGYHLRRVFALLYRMVGNRADAQDLAQEVFLKAFQRRHQLRDPDRALSWLLRIASNTAIDFQRGRAAERRTEACSGELEPESLLPSPEQQLVWQEREQRLHEALRTLSPKERAAIVLRDLEGLSGAEVARALGCSQITVRTHISSARIKLRRVLEKTQARVAHPA